MDREKLMEAGIDYDDGVRRFAGKPQIYEKYLVKMFEGNLMEILEKQLDEKKFSEAFRTAHDLKGTSGSLSLNVFYKKICELVEVLRGNAPDGDPFLLYRQAAELYEKAELAVREQANK